VTAEGLAKWKHMKHLDPMCTLHGKRWSEHQHGKCLYCCLCLMPLTLQTCNVRPDGILEDMCKSCASTEDLWWQKTDGKQNGADGHNTNQEKYNE
jgi:hypothetical protein